MRKILINMVAILCVTFIGFNLIKSNTIEMSSLAPNLLTLLIELLLGTIILKIVYDILEWRKKINLKKAVFSVLRQTLSRLYERDAKIIDLNQENCEQEFIKSEQASKSITSLDALHEMFYFMESHQNLNSGLVAAVSQIDDEHLFALYQILGLLNNIVQTKYEPYDELMKIELVKQRLELYLRNIRTFYKMKIRW